MFLPPFPHFLKHPLWIQKTLPTSGPYPIFHSKVLEKAVAAQLQDHLHHHNLYDKFQSGFRPAHSTETALVRVTNDLLMAADASSPSLLILLDLTAAFDTVDHNILLNRLHSDIGLSNSVLDWFTSYFSGRTKYVSLGEAKSHPHAVTSRVGTWSNSLHSLHAPPWPHQ